MAVLAPAAASQRERAKTLHVDVDKMIKWTQRFRAILCSSSGKTGLFRAELCIHARGDSPIHNFALVPIAVYSVQRLGINKWVAMVKQT